MAPAEATIRFTWPSGVAKSRQSRESREFRKSRKSRKPEKPRKSRGEQDRALVPLRETVFASDVAATVVVVLPVLRVE